MTVNNKTITRVVPPVPVNGKLDQEAIQILIANDQGGYTVPSEGMYPYQWNWDSVFVALGFATFEPDRAIREIETLFDAQWESGMVPHIVFRKEDPRYFPGPSVWRTHQTPESSGITQPPVAASIIWTLWCQLKDSHYRERLAALFPKILASHRWFHDVRDPGRNGIAVITHPWESGRDNSPEWDFPASQIDISSVEPYKRRDLDHADACMRPTQLEYDRYIMLLQYGRDCGWDLRKIAAEGPFRVADVGMSFMLMRADRDLLSLAGAINEPAAIDEIRGWIDLAPKGADFLWDAEAQTFCSRDIVTGRFSGFVTSASFLAFYADRAQPEQKTALLNHWNRIASQATYLAPSFDPDHDEFDSKRYWRGPCWGVVNYMLAHGFAEQGHKEIAARIKADTRTVIEKSGFDEAFCPLTGEGTGGHNFSWTAAMWLAWAGQP